MEVNLILISDNLCFLENVVKDVNNGRLLTKTLAVSQPGMPGKVWEFNNASGKPGIVREFDKIFRSQVNLKTSKLLYIYICKEC